MTTIGGRPLRAAEYFELEPAMEYWQCHWGPDDRGLARIKDSVRFAYDEGRKQGMIEERERLTQAVKAIFGCGSALKGLTNESDE